MDKKLELDISKAKPFIEDKLYEDLKKEVIKA